jgi:hypothetical protein
MARKERIAIPSKVKDGVLREFQHRCAICGGSSPQLHHIDENPANNDPLNLIPLCPNHHLTDQHSPSTKQDEGKMRLFRQYRDPTILSPRFQAVYTRLELLNHTEHLPWFLIEELCNDLSNFIRSLRMGDYYGSRIMGLLNFPQRMQIVTFGVSDLPPEFDEGKDRLFQSKVARHKIEIARLVVEQLRFQNWRTEDSGFPKGSQ